MGTGWILYPQDLLMKYQMRVLENEISIDETDDFEFNQDNSIEFENEYRSPGWDRYKKNKLLKWKIKKLRKQLIKEKSMVI